jgi:deazaflavin-dependent oxidoreductase (nitroreductase family)
MTMEHNCGHLRQRRTFALVLIFGAVVMTWLVALPRLFRRHRDAMLSLAPFRKFLTAYNGLARRASGTPRSSWGLLSHIGRRSGRRYQTSLGTTVFGDGFLLPLGYGIGSDWYRNIMATGRCELAWKGHTYQLAGPELITGPKPLQAWPPRDRILLRLAGIHDFVWVHRSEEPGGSPRNTNASPAAP